MRNDISTTLFSEGILDDAINKAENIAGVDRDGIQKQWATDTGAKAGDSMSKKDYANVAIQQTGDNLDRINQTLSPLRATTASIITRAKRSVLQFPIYVTQSLRINEAHIIAKTFERVYATLVQTVLAQNPILSEDEANNLVFLKQYHTNLKEGVESLVNQYYEPIDSFDQMMCESVFYSAQLSPNVFVEFKVIPTKNEDLIKENARLINEPLMGLAYLYEAPYTPSRKPDRQPSPVEVSTQRSRKSPERDVDDSELASIASIPNVKDQIEKSAKAKTISSTGVNGLKELIKMGKGPVIGDNKDQRILYSANTDKEGKHIGDRFYVPAGDQVSTTNKFGDRKPIEAIDTPVLLREADIKKANGMLPYTIQATFRIKTGNGIEKDVSYILGIKSVMHLIFPKDLAEDLREIVTGNVKSLQKVRYKTGELGFKDYFFNIKGIKADAARHINYDKRWMNTLKRLGEYERMNGTFLKKGIQAITGGEVPIPNGTLVLAQTDVTQLVNTTGIDLSLVSNARRLAKSLFLIAVVIVDTTAGTMRVLFPDNDTDWDVQSLASLDAELAKTDNNQLMREINKQFLSRG